MDQDVLSALEPVVQTNCHIADANYAGDYTLCTYLLKMREYYRWERRLSFDERLSNDAVGSWLLEREALWDQVREQDYRPLTIGGHAYGPFETEAINAALRPHGLVYSGGFGAGCRPHFFLARLLRAEDHPEYTILVSGDEYARDLGAPPAMSQGRSIFIRRESLRRMLWEKVEEWSWRKQEGAMRRALDYYDFQRDVNAALDAMTDNEIESVILHEIGEIKAGELLGEEWHDMLAALPSSAAELMARAVRDHLADCLSTLPALIESPTPACLHFYFGNLRSMRKELFPGLHRAYQDWVERDTLDPLHDITGRGLRHWQQVAERMLELYRSHGSSCRRHIEELVQANRL